jgi:hypothetical protein
MHQSADVFAQGFHDEPQQALAGEVFDECNRVGDPLACPSGGGA